MNEEGLAAIYIMLLKLRAIKCVCVHGERDKEEWRADRVAELSEFAHTHWKQNKNIYII